MLLAQLLLASGLCAETLRIEAAWVRAVPPMMHMTAAYLHCVNDGDAPVALLGARASGAGKVSLHATRRVGSQVSMQPADWPVLQPGESLVLEPGALHLMLEDLPAVPAPGESVDLCLLTDRREYCVAAPVRRGGPPDEGRHNQSSFAGERS